MNIIQNKTIIITGASQGLGANLACRLGSHQNKIVLIARTKKLLEKVRDQINSNNARAFVFPCDIRNHTQVEAVVAEISKQFSVIDILINNAGVWTDDDLEITRPGLRMQALETNVLGHFNFVKEVLPKMLKQKYGHILNVISTAGIVTELTSASDNSAWMSYGASKWAMAGFTRALKKRLQATQIKVSGFYPGGFERNLYQNAGRKEAHQQPWMMRTDSVSETIEFILSRPADVLVDELVLTKFITQ